MYMHNFFINFLEIINLVILSLVAEVKIETFDCCKTLNSEEMICNLIANFNLLFWSLKREQMLLMITVNI